MISGVERLVAFRYLRSKRQEGFISVVAWFSLLGIMLGVATLIIVMSVMNGFRADLLGRIIGLNGHVTVSAAEGRIDDAPSLLSRLDGVEGLDEAVAMVRGQVMVSARGGTGAAEIRGMSAEDFATITPVREGMYPGSQDGFGSDKGVVIGYRLANRLGLTVGDRLTLIAPNGILSQRGAVPSMRGYQVAGIFRSRNAEFDGATVFMSLNAAQGFFQTEGAVDAIDIAIADPFRATAMADRVQELLGDDYETTDWLRVNRNFVNALQVERYAMSFILSLIVVVAAFNVISSQIMLAQDKAKGIAILRTMGTTRASILRIFLITGSSVGIIGTAAGGILGLALALNVDRIKGILDALSDRFGQSGEVAFLANLPSVVDPMQVALTLVFAITISVGAAVYPAWRAASFDPVMVLRYE